MELTIRTSSKREIIDITAQVEKSFQNNSNRGVMCAVVVKHTTCALTTADLDPGTDLDFLDFLAAITPNISYRHPHDPSHTPDHLVASLIGPSVVLPLAEGRLSLGTWQRLVLVELSGPRQRQISINLVSAN